MELNSYRSKSKINFCYVNSYLSNSIIQFIHNFQMSSDIKVKACPWMKADDLVDGELKNCLGVKCKFCGSKIFPPKTAKYEELSEGSTI